MPLRVAGLLGCIVAVLAATLVARADVNCGSAIPVTMIDTMTTAHSYPGERFRFKTTAPARDNGIEIPMGTTGFGVVRYVHHAKSHNRGGLIVLEPRVLSVGGSEINIMADPRETAEFAPAYTLAEESLDFAPIGLLRTAIDAGRYGREVTLGPGFTFHIILVDDIAEKEPCVEISPSATPESRRQSAPEASASPSPSPLPSPSP